MTDIYNSKAIAARFKEQASQDAIRISIHAHQEMVEEDISYDEIREVLSNAHILENYPEHKRGACCLVCQRTCRDRFIHIVCTSSLEVAIIVTAYEPKEPKWVSPLRRGKR